MCGAVKESFRILGKRLNRSQGKRPDRLSGVTTTVVKCKNCNLIFSNPQPLPININDHYGVPPEDYWTEEYFKIDEENFKGEIDWYKQLSSFHEGSKALDIGSGVGKQLIAMKNAGFDVLGIEPSLPFYERAVSQMNLSVDLIINTTIEEADFENDSFDFISFGSVLEHLQTRRQLWAGPSNG